MSSMSCIQGQGSDSPLVVTHNRRNIRIARKGDVIVNAESPATSAVHIRNLCKNYGSSKVLRNYCMNVRKGTIYGLLGASGCGKTTVLSILVGLKKWDSGEVVVLGEAPGKIGRQLGYVPQDTALYNQLSIREMITFYGRLYNMTNQEITERWRFLTKLLELPSNFRLMGDLSGGQKRRASLSVALMHNPSLLVLDEPTVGLDPLLRRSIWNHLYKIVSTLNTTVIITTHYIEEASFSNTIGVMRRGRLLVENSPSALLHNFQCLLLEEVVLQLCRKDESSSQRKQHESNGDDIELKFTSNWSQEVSPGPALSINYNELMDGIFKNAVGFDCEINEHLGHHDEQSDASCFSKFRNSSVIKSLQRIRAVTTVILLTFLRHPLFIIPLLCIPAFHGTLTLVTIGTKPRGMNFGIVNHELPNWTGECDMPKHFGNSCDFSALSCKFINHIKKDELLSLIPYNEEQLALDEVTLGRSWGYMIFDSNYSQHYVDFLSAKHFATNESIEGSRIRVRMDFSQYIGSFFIIKDLYATFEDYIRQLALSCGIGGKEAEVPLKFRQVYESNIEDGYTEFLHPAVLICALFGIVGILTSVIFISDKRQGTLSRAQVAGLQTTDVMIGYMITQAVILLVQIFLTTAVKHLVFGVHILGSVWLYVFICLMSGLCGTVLGILLGILCEDEVESLIIGIFVLPVLLLYGGTFWPLESMALFWQRVGYILPTTLPIASIRSVVLRGLGFTHNLVWPGILMSFSWMVLLSICVFITFHRYTK